MLKTQLPGPAGDGRASFLLGNFRDSMMLTPPPRKRILVLVHFQGNSYTLQESFHRLVFTVIFPGQSQRPETKKAATSQQPKVDPF